MRFIVTLVFLFIFTSVKAVPLTLEEDVTFLPTSASVEGKGLWKLPIHHWIYSLKENSYSRKFATRAIGESLELAGLSDQDTKSANFKHRLKWFLVDNKGAKNILLTLSNIKIEKSVPLNSSANNGHAFTEIYLPFKKELQPHRWVKIETDGANTGGRKFYGEVQLIPEHGLSVISDIDDTIKISEVLDKKKLLKNIFVKPYQTTKGMPVLYQKLKKRGAYFHYVSASPWQLYPSLKGFMEKYYPKGSISLRYFRLKDSSIFRFFRSSQTYKIEKITKIIKRYPKHRFILIGDSGEHDPEVYANIYRQFPRNIQSIWIRRVDGSDVSKSRLATTFKGIPTKIWKIFDTPKHFL